MSVNWSAVTCSSEDYVIDDPIQRPDPLHNDLGVVDVFGDEARPVADGQDGILQQGVVLYKLKGLVWQVERAADVLLSHLVVNTLVEGEKKKKYYDVNSHPLYAWSLTKLNSDSKLISSFKLCLGNKIFPICHFF